jgi:hypothetical protein
MTISQSCSVNNSTSLIVIKNTTYEALTDVKIGDSYMAAYVAPGTYVDYWSYKTVSGKLSLKGVNLPQNVRDIDFKIKSGLYVYITAKYANDGTAIVSVDAVKNNSSTTDTGDWQE